MIIRIPVLSAVYISVNERSWFMTSILTLRRTIEDHIMGGLIYQTFLLRKLFALVVIPSTESRPTCWTFNTFTSIICILLALLDIVNAVNKWEYSRHTKIFCIQMYVAFHTGDDIFGNGQINIWNHDVADHFHLLCLLNFWSSFTFQPFYLGQLDNFMHEVKDYNSTAFIFLLLTNLTETKRPIKAHLTRYLS